MLAGARGGRTPARGGAEPARAVGAHRYDPIWAGPPLLTRPDHVPPARHLVHSGRLGRSALRSPDRTRLVPALGSGLGTGGCDDFSAICRRAHRRGDKAGLSRHSGTTRTTATRTGAPAGAGALTRRMNQSPR